MGFGVSSGWLIVSLIWGVGIAFLATGWRRRRRQSCIAYSDVRSLFVPRMGMRVRFVPLPASLRSIALGLMLLALADPYLVTKSVSSPEPTPRSASLDTPDDECIDLPTRGAALYLVLDRSGSMQQETVTVSQRIIQQKGGTRKGITRLDVLRGLTQQFVRNRPRDMIGLVAFARTAQVLAPLTLDHALVQEKLHQLKPVASQSQEGTAIGYALFKTVHLIRATKQFAQQEGLPYTIASTAIVLVTDGLQSPHPLDRGNELRMISIEKAAEYAEEVGIKTYIINVEPAIEHPKFRVERENMTRAARKTGGQFYSATTPEDLASVYTEIDALERITLPEKRHVQARIHRSTRGDNHRESQEKRYLAPYLVQAALACLVLAVGLDSTWLRRVP